MKRSLSLIISCSAWLAVVVPPGTKAADAIDFMQDVKPILESSCLGCHGPEKHKGNLRLDTRAGALKGGDKGAALVPGKPQESPLYASTVLPPGHDDAMPPKEPLDRTQSDVLRRW